jgi:hypothetical protein
MSARALGQSQRECRWPLRRPSPASLIPDAASAMKIFGRPARSLVRSRTHPLAQWAAQSPRAAKRRRSPLSTESPLSPVRRGGPTPTVRRAWPSRGCVSMESPILHPRTEQTPRIPGTTGGLKGEELGTATPQDRPDRSARQQQKSRRSTGAQRAGCEGDARFADEVASGLRAEVRGHTDGDGPPREPDERTDGPNPGTSWRRRARRRRRPGEGSDGERTGLELQGEPRGRPRRDARAGRRGRARAVSEEACAAAKRR